MNRLPSNILNRSAPEKQGVHSEDILAFVNDLEAEKFAVHSFMLIRHGQVIAEGWWRPFDPSCKRYVYSLTKSFTSTAVGFAVAEGLFKVVDKVVSFFPEELPPKVSENLAAMRVKDLLTMSTGHGMDSTLALIKPGLENWVQAILAFPVDYTPGTHFLYNSGATYLLSAIVQKASGQCVKDYLANRLFEPLGIQNVTWDVCPRGINTGGWGLSLTTEEIARFGLFYAQKGVWNGKRLLPSEWIEVATSACVSNGTEERAKEPLDWRQGYGYQFWRCQHGAYRADGASGQYCVVMPEQDAVLALTSETQNMQGILDLFWKHILLNMKDAPIPVGDKTQKTLQQKLSSLEMEVPSVKLNPEMEMKISKKHFKMNENEAGIQSVSFSFDLESSTFRLLDGQGEHQIKCGKGRWIKNETKIPFMLPSMMHLLLNQRIVNPVKVAGHGTWKDPQTYVMTWQYLETPHSDTVTCSFDGSEIRLDSVSSLYEPNDPLLRGKENRYIGSLVNKG
jgi:hypothetical protein